MSVYDTEVGRLMFEVKSKDVVEEFGIRRNSGSKHPCDHSQKNLNWVRYVTSDCCIYRFKYTHNQNEYDSMFVLLVFKTM